MRSAYFQLHEYTEVYEFFLTLLAWHPKTRWAFSPAPRAPADGLARQVQGQIKAYLHSSRRQADILPFLKVMNYNLGMEDPPKA